MIRAAVSKVMWVGRATVFLVGLAVILAVVLGAASMALGANGKPFILGENNTASALSKLTGNVNGAAMQVVNNNTGSNDTALNLQVQQGEAPMRVNSSGKVSKLNADKVDGREAPLWAVVNANGSLARGAGVVSSTNNVHLGSSAGSYTVTFNRGVSNCAYVGSLGGTQTGVKGEITAFGHGSNPNAVNVVTSDSAGNQEPALPFHLGVLC